MGKRLKVGILFGGRSGEHEVSLASAASVIAAIDKARYGLHPIGITREGRWILTGDPLEALKRGVRAGTGLGEAADLLSSLDVVFPVLHGPYGEDGTIQGLLELLGIPYVGGGVLASALGMDKALMKAAFRAHGLPVTEHLVLLRKDWEKGAEGIIAQIERTFGYPCFVKPSNLGSSVGVTKAKGREDLCRALDLASQYDRKLLVERALNCREIEVSVLGNDEPEASVPGEVVPKKEWYDYEAKYQAGMSDILIPAPLPKKKAEEFQHLAIGAFKAIDCAGFARVDFFLERKTEKIYVNEINTIPGFTATSVYPKLWEASGLSYRRLIDRLIELALERHAEKVPMSVSRENGGELG
ncbi:MAG: D-alanine--D-alanine ligase family protein [Candidatus Methylomirabilales bacterium]